MGCTPKSSKLDHFRIETHGDLGIPHDLRNPHLISLKLGWPNPPGVWLVDLLPPGAPLLGWSLSSQELALPYGHWMMAPNGSPSKVPMFIDCSLNVHQMSISSSKILSANLVEAELFLLGSAPVAIKWGHPETAASDFWGGNLTSSNFVNFLHPFTVCDFISLARNLTGPVGPSFGGCVKGFTRCALHLTFRCSPQGAKRLGRFAPSFLSRSCKDLNALGATGTERSRTGEIKSCNDQGMMVYEKKKKQKNK